MLVISVIPLQCLLSCLYFACSSWILKFCYYCLLHCLWCTLFCVQAINGFLVLLLIPLFEIIIYPLLDKCKVPNRWGYVLKCSVAATVIADKLLNCSYLHDCIILLHSINRDEAMWIKLNLVEWLTWFLVVTSPCIWTYLFINNFHKQWNQLNCLNLRKGVTTFASFIH